MCVYCSIFFTAIPSHSFRHVISSRFTLCCCCLVCAALLLIGLIATVVALVILHNPKSRYFVLYYLKKVIIQRIISDETFEHTRTFLLLYRQSQLDWIRVEKFSVNHAPLRSKSQEYGSRYEELSRILISNVKRKWPLNFLLDFVLIISRCGQETYSSLAFCPALCRQTICPIEDRKTHGIGSMSIFSSHVSTNTL